MPLKATDRAAAEYARNLSQVLDELETQITGIIGEAKTARDSFDAATLLNNRGAFLQALRDSGYTELANQHVEKYPNIVEAVKKDFGRKGLPQPSFSTAQVETFKQIAKADLQMFSAIGTKAVDDIRLELYRHAVSSRPFSDMVRVIKEGTTGTAKNGSPLSNYSYTHANTAVLKFSGEAIREAGESIEAERWEVVGPLDSATREVCRKALRDPVRTTEEWKDADYWGGSPGGWNCRHQLYPNFEDIDEEAPSGSIEAMGDYSNIKTMPAEIDGVEITKQKMNAPYLAVGGSSGISVNTSRKAASAWKDMDSYQKKAYESGWSSSPNPNHVILHELAHVKVKNMSVDLDSKLKNINKRSNPTFAKISAKVSRYAGTNGHEFVSEVYAAHRSGIELPKDVMDYYNFLGGPEL